MKKIIINFRSSHHSSFSGYDRLLDYIDDAIKIPSDRSEKIIPYKLAKFIGSFVDKNKGEYNSDSVRKEIELYRYLKSNNNKKIIHYLNAERDIRFIVNHKHFFDNSYFIGTFHKPNEILKKQITNSKYLKKLDGAIAVGPNQVDFLKNWLNIENVKFIPHGIDTKFFIPDFSKREDYTLLFVGQHLRDFDTFNKCIPKIAEQTPSLKVNVILHKSYKKYVEPHSSIEVFSDVNDLQLKSFYQRATALFLPLLDSTACNSILEAMAVGLPIISSDVGGNYGYINSSNSILAPKGDVDILVEASVSLLKNEIEVNKMSEKSLELSRSYNWEKVASQLNDYYKTCVDF